MGKPNKLTEEQRLRIKQLRGKGWTYHKLALEFHVSPSAIQYWIFDDAYREKWRAQAKKRMKQKRREMRHAEV